MKNELCILLTLNTLMLCHLSMIGQSNNHIERNKNFIVWVTPIDSSSIIKGYLSEVEDSLIVISNFYNYKKQRIYNYDIKEIKFRNKGNIGKGFAIGALSGFAVGAIAGLAAGDDSEGWIRFTAGQKALVSGVALALPGALIGGMIGAAKIKIPINGNKMTQKQKLLKYKRPF